MMPSNTDAISSSRENSGRFLDRLESFNVNSDSFEVKNVMKKAPELLSCSEEYKDIILKILKFLQGLGVFVDTARDALNMIIAVTLLFEEEQNRNQKKRWWQFKKKANSVVYQKTLAKLEEISSFCESFTELDVNDLHLLKKKLCLLKAKVQERRDKITKRLRSIKWWRKVLRCAYTVLNLAVLICSIVLAVESASTASITIATSTATGMRFLDPFFDKFWRKEEKQLEAEKEVMQLMLNGGLMEHDCESIQSQFNKIRIAIESVREDVNFMLNRREEVEAMKIGVSEMKNKIKELESCISDLKAHIEECNNDVQNAASDFMKKIEKLVVYI